MCLHTFLCRSVPILLHRRSSKFLHRGGSISPKNFEGYLACGASCYMLHYYLRAEFGIETKMMLKRIGREDHCYLQNDMVIFDPTYRQFLQQSKWLSSFIYTGNLKGLETHVGRPWWSGAVESDEKMDAGRVLTDIDYAANKGEGFLRLNKEFSNKKFSI